MRDKNDYVYELTETEIAQRYYREVIGGCWAEMGKLQFDFLKQQGLKPQHRLVDIGCGALRAGVLLIPYLDEGNYYGLDINPSIMQGALHELEVAGLGPKKPHLLVDDRFNLHRFGTQFDFALAQSVFSHLPMNDIIVCLVQVAKVLEPDGRFFATFFKAPASAYIEPWKHRSGVVSYYDQDPYHYSKEEMAWMGERAGLKMDYIGKWDHPRGQHMLVYRKGD